MPVHSLDTALNRGIRDPRLGVMPPPAAPRVVDVDVGTQGQVINVSSHDLFTFDPFDSPLTILRPAGLLTRNLTIMPYAVSTVDGEAPFFFNRQVPGCSSMNRVNSIYRHNRSALEHQAFCESGRASPWRMGLIRGCRSGVVTVEPVRTVRLSTVLAREGVQKLQHLKLDTQGSDFAILRDVLESGITVMNAQLECQDYSLALPLYDALNDCRAIVAYLEKKHPSFRVRWHSANCPIAEFNLFMSRRPASPLLEFQTARLPVRSKLTDAHGRWAG